MSPDISKCENEECPLKDFCYRYTSKNSPFWQHYGDFTYNEETDDCDGFWLAEGQEKAYQDYRGHVTTKDLTDDDEVRDAR